MRMDVGPYIKKIGISFTATELGTIVPKGMDDYWLRPIRFYESERRNFLGTLFSEGGFTFPVTQRIRQSLSGCFLQDPWTI